MPTVSRRDLFQPDDVVDRYPGQHRQFLAAQALGASGGVGRQAGLCRGQPAAPAAQHLRQFAAVHPFMVAGIGLSVRGTAIPRKKGRWHRFDTRRTVEA